MAQLLEELGGEGLVLFYVMNQNLGLSIPDTINGKEHNYLPDFIVRIRLPSPLAGETVLSPSPMVASGSGSAPASGSESPPARREGLLPRREEPLARRGEGSGEGENILNLIIEVTDKKDKDKTTKAETARKLWEPAVNNHGGFGRWAFLEIADPWDAKNSIRASVSSISFKGTIQ
ncbi:MAG: hypothetical protein MUO28_07615 [Desulfobacterales bacterium]|nr:hypothetical protein [Desulfobacterales bacterium]